MCRGGRGKDLDQPLQYVPLCGMSNSWLEAVIDYEEEFRPNNLFTKWYKNTIGGGYKPPKKEYSN